MRGHDFVSLVVCLPSRIPSLTHASFYQPSEYYPILIVAVVG